ncbi:hypothetical protein IFT37_06425 [Pseudomonas fluorescens]|uniref:NACHT domain-containing protein n=1 Tax=Pseudomonas fluorescens TaxID=294 RepID=UPI001782B47E|nr:hypothetical protein [Pseudomonas fluorescens]MBD8151080.1 hypothetical protein [Pseudomonas fluorescens]MBD8179667.1 hypothetical protein [Pseudomonas fluorescens]MBD8744733.1 hypothetical protein [Pseudomonas fluorescens]MBD8748519.1 hypothetical protein [Pseudomonas fluorescens]MBD8762417.1 hypothetical protein [Pseudomonas fluorescens]
MESNFLPRTLWHHNEYDTVEVAHTELDAEFRAQARPLIILGEAGMGKSCLLGWLAETYGYSIVTAQQLSLPLFPGQELNTTKGLVIDALDELHASSPMEALMKILEPLGRLGYPQFILSCRASDWMGDASAAIIERSYKVSPLQMHLGALTEEQIQQALRDQLGIAGASNLIEHLNARRLDNWLGNPLTLGLITEIAKTGSPLPERREELFRFAVKQLISERNPNKSASAPAEQDALDAAGAACAALILCGFGAISRAAASDNTLPLAEASRLSGSTALAQVLATRLFDAVGVDRFNYSHRSIGEYLAADWLRRQADSPRKRRRIVASFHRSGLVPASLRGVHAWLALDPHLAPEVLTVDPVGVIECGDPEQLTSQQARALLRALDHLATRNPGFLPDFHSLSLRGAIRAGMESELFAVLEQPSKSVQLRLMLLESIPGTIAASQLAPMLQALVRNSAEIFAIRRAALEGLSSSLSEAQSHKLIQTLMSQNTDDSARLALDLTGLRGYASFDDSCIIKLVIACAFHDFRFGEEIAKYDHLVGHFPGHRIASFLEKLTQAVTALTLAEEITQIPEISDLVVYLTLRYLDEESVVPSDLLRWLRFAATQGGGYYPAIEIDERLEKDEPTRHAIQRLALLSESGEERLASRHYDLQLVSKSLRCSEADVIALLNSLDSNDLEDDRWRQVVGLLSHTDDHGADLRAAARVFAWNRPDGLVWIEQLSLQRSESEVAELIARSKKLDAQALKKKHAEVRLLYLHQAPQMLSGDFDSLQHPAVIYLGQWQTYRSGAAAHERLSQWLGRQLAKSAMRGFEAYLQGIPSTLSATEVASFYAKQDWFFDTPDIGRAEGLSPFIIIAAASERHRTGIGFNDLTDLALMTAFLAIYNWFYRESHPLRPILDQEIQARGLWEQALRLLHEPQLYMDSHRGGFDDLLHFEKDKKLVTGLATDWLRRLPSMAAERENQLIKMLLEIGKYDELRALVQRRTPPSPAHHLNWDAVGLMINFQATAKRLSVGPVDKELLPCLRALEPGYFFGAEGRPYKLDIPLQEWIIATFRALWPYTRTHIGDITDMAYGWHDTEGELAHLIKILGDLTTPEAIGALTRLCESQRDTYTDLLLDAKAKQQRLCHESAFTHATLEDLIAITKDVIPRCGADLQAWVLEEIDAIQGKITSDDVGSWRGFYRTDQNIPVDENSCRDHLVGLLRQGSPGVAFEPETNVAANKKVDITCSTVKARLPIEIKGQWHKYVWTAADNQLDKLYTPDHRADGLGIYLVLWFGKQADSAYTLRSPGKGIHPPSSAEEMAKMLEERCQAFAQGRVKIVVLDLARSSANAGADPRPAICQPFPA